MKFNKKDKLRTRFFLIVLLLYSNNGCHGMQMASRLAKQHGLMRRMPLRGSLLGSRIQRKSLESHLVPTDKVSMQELGLCPLFTQQEGFQMDPIIVQEMMRDLRSQGLSEADIKQQLAGLTKVPGPKYHVFKSDQKNAWLEEKEISIDAPCVESLGNYGEWNRILLQLKSLNQFELAEKTTLSPALCAGHALNNACLIRDYAETGEIKYLKYLGDINSATNFLLDLTIDDWINVETVKDNLKKMGIEFNIDVSNISAISTVDLFNSNLDKTPDFAVFNPEEFAYVQNLKQRLRNGLKENNFVHVIIIGNEEVAETHGHYFAFAIIKEGNNIQYVVLDTLPNVYHLQKDSHERNRLMFLIENIEQGNAVTPFHNLRTRPEFIESLGTQDEESLLETDLINERMPEEGMFKDRTIQLNNFSKLLTRFGIKKQLQKESLENILMYLQFIQEIESSFGEGLVYPTLKNILLNRISDIT